MDVQLLLGLILYFALIPLTRTALMDMGAAMGVADLRFFAIEPIFRTETSFRHKLHLSSSQQRTMEHLCASLQRELDEQQDAERSERGQHVQRARRGHARRRCQFRRRRGHDGRDLLSLGGCY